jgi:hypothetical protein
MACVQRHPGSGASGSGSVLQYSCSYRTRQSGRIDRLFTGSLPASADDGFRIRSNDTWSDSAKNGSASLIISLAVEFNPDLRSLRGLRGWPKELQAILPGQGVEFLHILGDRQLSPRDLTEEALKPVLSCLDGARLAM